jgi:hypothetical protein
MTIDKNKNPYYQSSNEARMEANEAAIGCSFLVEAGVKYWVGKVVRVKDAETFVVDDGYGGEHNVSMYKLRSLAEPELVK